MGNYGMVYGNVGNIVRSLVPYSVTVGNQYIERKRMKKYQFSVVLHNVYGILHNIVNYKKN